MTAVPAVLLVTETERSSAPSPVAAGKGPFLVSERMKTIAEVVRELSGRNNSVRFSQVAEALGEICRSRKALNKMMIDMRRLGILSHNGRRGPVNGLYSISPECIERGIAVGDPRSRKTADVRRLRTRRSITRAKFARPSEEEANETKRREYIASLDRMIARETQIITDQEMKLAKKKAELEVAESDTPDGKAVRQVHFDLHRRELGVNSPDEVPARLRENLAKLEEEISRAKQKLDILNRQKTVASEMIP